MITILISPDYERLVSTPSLEKAVVAVFEQEGVDPTAEITILVDNDQAIQKLNLQFLGIDAPTDVLSFPANEMNPETHEVYLGDIIISFPQAKMQAELAGESVDEEIQLLVVHGLLHLLGYDHSEPEDKVEMWSAQKEVLRKLGLKITHIPE